MNFLKSFKTLDSLLKASKAQSKKEWRAAMDSLIRPPMVDSAPKTMKLWSLKEQQEFYQNNPIFKQK